MTTITIVGGTGYAGSAIVREAARRGHDVVSFSRTIPEPVDQVAGVRYESGSMLDAAARSRAVSGSDAVVSALSPRGELDGRIVEADLELATLAAEHGARFGVVGGFSTLRTEEGGARMVDGDDLPPQFASEARQMGEVLNGLFETADTLDWFYISPAMQFGSYAPGENLGHYRVGGEVAFFDAEGVSAISGPDFALAIVDELEKPVHHRAHFSVAY